MLKSSEHSKLSRYSNDDSPNLKDFSEIRSADPPIFILILNSKNRILINLLVKRIPFFIETFES